MNEKTVILKDLGSQEHIYKKLIDELDGCSIILLDTEGNIQTWNKGAEKIKGYTSKEIIGKHFSVFYTEEDRKKLLPEKLLKETLEKGKIITEGWRQTKDGDKIWINSIFTVLHNDEGNIVGFSKTIRDCTEKKKQEEQQDYLSTIIANLQDPLITTTTDYIITDWNAAASNLFEWEKEEVIGKSIAIFNSSYIGQNKHEMTEHFAKNGFWKGEAIFHTKSGTPVYLLITASHLKDKSGIVTGVLVFAKDITKRKTAEQALESLNNNLEQKVKERTKEIMDNNKRFQSLVENDYTITLLIDENTNIIYRSPSATTILGTTNEEDHKIAHENNYHPEELEIHKNNFKEAYLNPNKAIRSTFRLKHKNGNYLWMDCTVVNRLHDPALMAFVVNMRDITEQKNIEQKLIEGQKKYQQFIERISNAFFALDRDFKYIYANKKTEYYTKISAESIIGRSVWDVFPQAVDTQLYDDFMQAMKKQQYICNAYYNPPKNIWLENHIYPSPEGISVFVNDISERKHAEMLITQLNENLEEKVKQRTAELLKSNKALESFSYMVSHDLRSPLRTLNGFTNIILEKYESNFDAELKKMFQFILNNSMRMNMIIEDLLKLAKYGKDKLNITSIDMTALFQKVWNELPKAESVSFILDPLPTIQGDSSMIEQIITNLLSNAIKYSSKTLHPVIQVGYTTSTETPAYFIKDNGVGFSMDFYNKLFDAFQRFHSAEKFEGTGIGLYIVKQIIENHNGKIWAYSEPDKGATFYFTIPEKKQ